MRIAVAQLRLRTGDLEGNAEKVVEAIRRARQQGCDLVVTPETAITGYMSCDLLEVDGYVRANRRLLDERIVPATEGIAAVVGFVDYAEQDGRIARRYNGAAVIQDGRVLAVGHKRCLCRYRFYDETRYFLPGEGPTVQPVTLGGRGVRLAPLVCEDLWDTAYEASPYQESVQAGAQLVTVVNASPFETGKHAERLELLRRHQAARSVPIVYVNTVGIGDDLKDLVLFDGRSLVTDGAGQLVWAGPLLDDELGVVELDEQMRGTPQQAPSWQEEAELDGALTFALREYCTQSGFEQAVLGVSGGVDSSLCAALAARALGPDNVLGVSLPGPHNCPETRRDAERLCRNLNIGYTEIPIGGLHERVQATYSAWQPIRQGVTLENFQARLRGLLLMGVSNETGRMVIATGNKTELGLGYCTLYGDMVGGMLLLGDVNKHQVYRLARHINEQAGAERVPATVLDRAPNAELAPDQEDPFDYALVVPLVDELIARHDAGALLERFRRRELGPGYPADLYDRYDEAAFRRSLRDTYRRYQQSAFKRAQASPIVIVSSRALGFDLRETIINHWQPDLGPKEDDPER